MKTTDIALAVALALAVTATARSQSAAGSPTNVWTAPARAARKLNPVPSDAQSLAKGKELFSNACIPCHGPAGQGNGPAAASLERKPANLSDPKLTQETDGALFWKVTEGNTPMPSFREAFSDDQRWEIINYVRTLAPKESQTTVTKK